MYRKTQDNNDDFKAIVDIYNDITSRRRTETLHRWEWFESPYENQSYVIIDKYDNILGHHGILTIKFNFQDKTYTAGKTENTIMKQEYGSLYFKNEMEMHKEYLSNYDILITTTAKGVIKKIREKLGYRVFGNYVSFIRFIDIKFLVLRVKNPLLKNVLNFFAPLINTLFVRASIDTQYKALVNTVSRKDLEEIEDFYNKEKNNHGFTQIRSKEFLEYKILNNPYIEYNILKLYLNEKICGYLIYHIAEHRAAIEDIFFDSSETFNELLNRVFNYIKENKHAYALTFTTLEKSMLDKDIKGFFRRANREESDKFMIKNNIKDDKKDDLQIENFYFTKLMMEGIK